MLELQVDEETKRCLLCVRVPLEYLVENCMKVLPVDTAYEVAERAATLIRDAYLKKPYEMCGKTRGALGGGAVYVSSLLLMTETQNFKKYRLTQNEIARAFGTTDMTVRNRYIHLMEVLEMSLGDLNGKNYLKRDSEIRKRSGLKAQETRANKREFYAKHVMELVTKVFKDGPMREIEMVQRYQAEAAKIYPRGLNLEGYKICKALGDLVIFKGPGVNQWAHWNLHKHGYNSRFLLAIEKEAMEKLLEEEK